MTERLSKRLEDAKRYEMSSNEKEEQRRSFAYGNAHLENEDVTRETVDKAAEKLDAESGG